MSCEEVQAIDQSKLAYVELLALLKAKSEIKMFSLKQVFVTS
jgi:hypothetical protein